jgi:hypothetical protein
MREYTENRKCGNPDCRLYGRATLHSVRRVEGQVGFARMCVVCGKDSIVDPPPAAIAVATTDAA